MSFIKPISVFSRLASRSKNKGIVARGETFAGFAIEEITEQWMINEVFALNDYAWEESATSLIEATIGQAGNPGQEAIINDELIPLSLSYIEINNKEFEYIAFRLHIQANLGEEKYNAIDLIVEDLAEGLNELHNSIYGNNGFNFAITGLGISLGSYARKLSSGLRDMPASGRARSVYWHRHSENLRNMSDLNSSLNWRFMNSYNPNSRYGTFANALSVYRKYAIANYKKQFPNMYHRGISFDSYTASAARNRVTATKFLNKNPNGIARTSSSTAFIPKSYKIAARRNGKILP